MKNTKKMVFMAILTALGVVFGVIDAQISAFVALVPGAKIGLANIVLMIAIVYFDFRDGFLMAFLKSLLVGLLLGAISTFLIGFTGTILSFIGMYLFYTLLKKNISMISVSVVGGALHSIGQVIAVMWFYNTEAAIVFIPQLLLISVATGVLTGMLTASVLSYLDKSHVFEM